MFKVLVIDDEEMVRDLLKKVLSLMPVNVETADDAEIGMDKFDNDAYDLVITDVRMPGVDGHQVVHHIRRSERCRTPIIGVSGTPWLLHDGDFDDVLQKPFTIHNLMEKVQCLAHDAMDDNLNG